MDGLTVIWVAPIIILLGCLVAVWEIWICEGSHLGQRFVVWLYDLTASRYDRIKGFDLDWEVRFLGEPIAASVGRLAKPTLLDIGAGTGRTARAVNSVPGWRGKIVALEPSRQMLTLGRSLTPKETTVWLRGWAADLPFCEARFDLVVSLELVEFTPRPLATLAEMVRVLRPGGWLLVTNRTGKQAPWILGKTFHPRAFADALAKLGLQEIQTFAWQVEYDLVWARKP